MADYKVLSPHLDRSKISSYTTTISPEQIKSMQHLTPTVSSFPYGNSTNHLVDGKVATVTSGNIFWTTPKDYAEYGFFSQLDDGVNRGNVSFSSMDNWIANGTMNKPVLPENQPIPTYYQLTNNKVGGILYIEGITPTGLWMSNHEDTQVGLYTTKDLVNINDMNATGKRVSQAENFRQKIHSNLLFNDDNQFHYEITKWVEFLDSQGVHPTKHPVLGIGVGKGGYVAFHTSELNYLVANTDFREIAAKYVEKYGLTDSDSVSAMERSVMMHELAHAFGIGGSDIEERLQGKLQTKFYSKLAKEFAGTKFEKVYKALAREGEDYAERFSLINRLVTEHHYAGPPWQLMEHKFFHEAEALGLEGKAAENYIKARQKNSLGPLYVEEDRNENKSKSKGKRKMSSLERIVESEAEYGQETKADSNYASQRGTAKILKFVKGRSKGKDSGKSETYSRSSARETYERNVPSAYSEDSRTVEPGREENSDARTSEKSDSRESAKGEPDSNGRGENQASEKAA